MSDADKNNVDKNNPEFHMDQIKKAMSTLHEQLISKETTYKEHLEKTVKALMVLVPGIDNVNASNFIINLVKLSHDYTSMINLLTQIELGKMAINAQPKTPT